jgi:AraC-like DNA-binding protein
MAGTVARRRDCTHSTVRQIMSQMRHDAGIDVRSDAVTYPAGTVLGTYIAPGWDRLLHAVSGVMSVETEAGIWVVPPHRALWVPDGHDYRVQMHGRVAVRNLYLRYELAALPADLTVVNVTPLVRELILHVCRIGPLVRGDPRQSRLADVIVDQLDQLPQAPLRLHQPIDPRGRRAADLITEEPAIDLVDVARRVGASRRTLERIFLTETGLPLGAWRRQLRVLHALRLLGAGHAVTEVAARVGYATPSAFASMFKAQLGGTPAGYFAERDVTS